MLNRHVQPYAVYCWDPLDHAYCLVGEAPTRKDAERCLAEHYHLTPEGTQCVVLVDQAGTILQNYRVA